LEELVDGRTDVRLNHLEVMNFAFGVSHTSVVEAHCRDSLLGERAAQ
jgi:hypothetical protein